MPLHAVLVHAEVVLEHAAHPQRRRLLILPDPDALPVEVVRFVDASVVLPALRAADQINHALFTTEEIFQA
ncbi:MAG: hypothetical protein IIC60_03610 [Proteobacteria bacterium]|nr:hypothetical protein [Pseudomonadota bacterium]